MILSGFLTRYSLSRKKSQSEYNFFDYFINRTKRFYPELILSLVIIAVLDLIMIKFSELYTYTNAFNLKTLIGNVFFLQGFPSFGIEPFGSARPLWTLSIEWWLYLSVAWLYLGKRKQLYSTIGLFTLFVLAFYPMFNFLQFFRGNERSIVIYWLLGWISYSLYKLSKKINISKSSIVIISIVGFALMIYRLHLTKQAYDLVFAVILTLQLLACMYMSNKFSLQVKVHKFGSIISDYTYSAYLVHYSIMFLVYYLFNKNNHPLLLLLSILLSLVASVCITKIANLYRLNSK